MASILLDAGSENFVSGLGIALAGLVIVFAVLLIICAILYLFGHLFYKKPENKAVIQEVKKAEAPAPAPVAAAAEAEPEANEEELVAAIMAAISMTLQAGDNSGYGGFVVRSYRRIGRKQGRATR